MINVDKHATLLFIKLEGGVPKEGDTVSCKVDETRRANITKNHTSTHIINASSREVLGSWIWQHSAFKDDDHARLDITHHSSLTDEQVKQIEDAANQHGQTKSIQSTLIIMIEELQSKNMDLEFIRGV